MYTHVVPKRAIILSINQIVRERVKINCGINF